MSTPFTASTVSSSTAMISLEHACDALAREWETDARARRKLSKHDIAADTLEYCAQMVREAVTRAAADDVELTVAQYAALHGSTAPTVRRWCQSGAIRARMRGRGWLIRRSEQPPTFTRGSDHELSVHHASASLSSAA